MKKLLRSVATVAVATVVSGTLVAGLAGTASAYGSAPPWESTITPTPEVGGLTFYNSTGQVITGGSTSSGPVAAYIQGSSVVRAGDTSALLNAYTPVIGVAAGSWSGEGVSGQTNFPNSGAPAALASSSLPLVTGSTGDYSLSNYVGDFPNNDTSTTDGYKGLYVLRLYTGATGHGTSSTYDEAVISISGSSWTLDYSPTTATTTTLAASPASPQLQGTTVALTATVSPGAPGSVQFFNGATAIGSPVTVAANGTAQTNVTGLPVGANSLTATFTPTTGAAFGASTSSAVPYTITAPTPTSTSLAVSPASPEIVGTPETLTATEAPVVAGSVQFFSGATSLGTATSTGGTAALTNVTSLPVGSDSLTAVFTPTSNAYASSTSPTVPFTVDPSGESTATALSVNPSTAEVGSTVTATANVTDTGAHPLSVPTGTVQFYDNGTNTSGVVGGSSVALGGAVTLDASGVATLTESVVALGATGGLQVGAHNLVAVFGGSPSFQTSTSGDVVFNGLPVSSSGNSGADNQNLQVGIPAGAVYLSTPYYNAATAFSLGNAALNPGDSEYVASGAFGSTTNPGAGVSVTDTRAGNPGWTASATVTDFGNGTGGVINGQNLEFTNVAPSYITGNALGPVSVTQVPSGAFTTVPYASAATGSDGLKGGPHTFASAAPLHGDGSVYVDGTLSLVAPTSTPSGTYSATLTFTIV